MANMNYNKSNLFCNNCGKSGHLFHQCKLPITSIGIIVMRRNNNKTELLLIRRKNSLGFVDFMRGKYNINNKTYIINLLNKMTRDERKLIIENDFNYLWKYLWGININTQYKNEEKISRDKLNNLKTGVIFNNKIYTIETLIDEIYETYDEPEWGFPKGRRNFQEKDLNCALREFEEETGYSKNDVKIIYNIFPLEEIYTGSNYKSYKHKYFIAIMDNNKQPNNHFQETEISKIEWVPINDTISYIRHYNVEKINIIKTIQLIIKDNNIYL